MSDEALPSGRGTFLIKRVFTTDKETDQPLLTKAGVPKVLVIVEVRDKSGRTASVFEHIVEKSTVNWKREALFKGCGMAHLCVADLNRNIEHLEGNEGECMIALEEYNGENRCIIKKYYPPIAKVTDPIPTPELTTFDDDIPF